MIRTLNPSMYDPLALFPPLLQKKWERIALCSPPDEFTMTETAKMNQTKKAVIVEPCGVFFADPAEK